MWVLLLLIIGFIVAKFLYDRNKQSQRIQSQGGMRIKYNKLISELMEGNSRTRIINETPDSITVGLISSGGETIFILTESFGTLNVRWKTDGPVFGKEELNWDFSEAQDQEEMAYKIMMDVGEIQIKNIRNHGFDI